MTPEVEFSLAWGPIVHVLWDYTRYVNGGSQEPRLLGIYREYHDAELVGRGMTRDEGPIRELRIERVGVQ